MSMRLGLFGVVASAAAVSLCAVFIGCDSPQKDDKYVTMVKDGSLSMCPNYTIGTLVENTINDLEWESGKAGDGSIFVNIKGRSRLGQDWKLEDIFFQLLIDGNSFNISTCVVNGTPQSDYQLSEILKKMCKTASDYEPIWKEVAEAKRALEKLPKFTDSRDGKVYRKTTINGQTWMAENLNYAADKSVCFNSRDIFCENFGRLYDWSTAQTACPAGWHLPSKAEWEALTDFVGGEKIASRTDDYAFTALRGIGGIFTTARYDSYIGWWWTDTDSSKGDFDYKTSYIGMDSKSVLISIYGKKSEKMSVRCVQNDGKTSSAPAQSKQTQSAVPAQQSNTETVQSAAPAQQSNTDVTEYVQNGMKYLESGDNNRRAADYDLAVAEFDKAIRLSQNNAEAYYGRGRAYLRKGDNSQAVADYTQAIRLNPNDVISYSNRGRAYARMGDYDNAVSDFESALRIDPNNAAIKQNLEKARKQEKGL